MIPFNANNGIRIKHLQWLLHFYNRKMPEVEVCIGENLNTPFNKSKAINVAARKATGSIYVLTDCDVLYDPELIVEALELLKDRPWVIPFNRVLDISKDKTEEILHLEPEWPLNLEGIHYTEYPIYKSFAGKIIICSRDSFHHIGGFDERFIGWGGEDDAFQYAMSTLCGPFSRLNRTIYHFWHPHVGAHNNPHFHMNDKLLSMYMNAFGNREAMLRLINDWKRFD